MVTRMMARTPDSRNAVEFADFISRRRAKGTALAEEASELVRKASDLAAKVNARVEAAC